jgi:hypothetical protein
MWTSAEYTGLWTFVSKLISFQIAQMLNTLVFPESLPPLTKYIVHTPDPLHTQYNHKRMNYINSLN